MTAPLVALAIPSAIVGLLNIPGVSWPVIGNFTDWLAVRVVEMGDHHAETIDLALAAIGLVAAVAGGLIGWMIYGKDRETQRQRDRFQVPLLYPLLHRRYYLDDAALAVSGAT